MTDSRPAVDLQQLALFHGQLSPQQAYVYVRLAGVGVPSDWQLRGKIVGPINHLTRTLPATVALREMGAGDTGAGDTGPGSDRLARVIVPDPCCWAPGQPYRYQVHIELVADNQVVATESRNFGMRMLGIHKQHIYWESRPWHLQGARESVVEPHDNAVWREAALVRRLQAPSDQQCELASRDGVMLLADLDQAVAADPQRLEREVMRLSRHAAVAVVAVPAEAAFRPQIRDRAPNLLVAQRCPVDHTLAPGNWADLVICETDDPLSLGNQLRECPIPVLIQQVGDGAIPMDEAVERCRQLAAALEPLQCVAGCLL